LSTVSGFLTAAAVAVAVAVADMFGGCGCGCGCGWIRKEEARNKSKEKAVRSSLGGQGFPRIVLIFLILFHFTSNPPQATATTTATTTTATTTTATTTTAQLLRWQMTLRHRFLGEPKSE
jgi:hypothetical protein